jgi:hypothetical protein
VPHAGPAQFSVIETLRNAGEIEIRAQRPQNRSDLEAAIANMSDESLYRRFFVAKHHFSEKEVEYFLNIDFVNHVTSLRWRTRIASGRSLAPGAMSSLSLAWQKSLSASSMNIRDRASAPR